MLVGENGGEGGLRRGSGRRSRGKIGGVEFGGPLITPSGGELGTEREGGVS